ncbi:MAG: Orotate phosphoribosyltransferase [Firmicutes bacterium ADurb.Bin356]|nr:MAG: Orotate phosphoribosyltransferase [Firmicutes bacterium ADurb.Bin356]
MDTTLKIMKDCGAFLEGHFLLSSGRHSSSYCQCAKLMRLPELAEKVLSPVAQRLKEFGFTKVCGPAMGGITVSYELARQLGSESIFTERIDGVVQLRRGFTAGPHDIVLIAEDVITTGKSTLETLHVLESFGARVLALACIVDRRPENLEFPLPVYSAIKLDIKTYDAGECPLCEEALLPLEKPGSRKEL